MGDCFIFFNKKINMGRVIIKFKDGHLESFKCKSKEKATKIADNRNNVVEFNFFEDNDYIPRTKKKKVQPKEMSMAEMEAIISRL